MNDISGRELGFNRPTSQSSQLGSMYSYKAVDGRYLELSQTLLQAASNTCFSSRLWGEETAWWSVDLQTPFSILGANFYGQLSGIGNQTSMKVFISQQMKRLYRS